MTAAPNATVLLPTTGDRGPLLPHSVGSVLRQTVPCQVIIVGDGLDRTSADIARRLEASDDRVVFLDLPKGPSRGEAERDRIIRQHARGEVVTYLCDRDLYLPHHVETALALLGDADLAYTLRFRIGFDDEVIPGTFPDLTDPSTRNQAWARIPLSFAAHRLGFYLELPHGWRTTPAGRGTDTYMWEQMLDQPGCRVAAGTRPTVLSFKRGPFPGWPTSERLGILERWDERSRDPELEQQLVAELITAHVAQASRLDVDRPGRLRFEARRALRTVRSRVALVRARRRRRPSGMRGGDEGPRDDRSHRAGTT